MADEAGGQELGTRMIRQATEGERKRGDRPTNDWCYRECDDAGKAGVATVGVHGSGSVQAGSSQRALHLLSRCCSCLSMEVNVSKTVRMALNPRFHRGLAVNWSYNAQQVEMVDSFKYLGTVIEARGWVGKA